MVAWGHVSGDHEILLDVYNDQVLSPGHLARLGEPSAGSKALAAGRVSLTVGSPSDWSLRHPAALDCAIGAAPCFGR